MISLRLQKRRGSFELDVAFDVPSPGVAALFGPSGCGKTTLIDLVAGLLTPDAGRIEVDGKVLFDAGSIDLPAEKRRIGYVFQDARLFPHASVLGNLRYGERRAPRHERHIGLDEVLDLLGIGALLSRRPRQLSGGERQRVAIGRALLSQPRLLLLDEPLASIDPARREEVLPYLERLRDRLRIPIIYVSHHFEEVSRLATRVVLLDAGRVVAAGDDAGSGRGPGLLAISGMALRSAALEGVVESLGASGAARLRIGGGRISVFAPGASVGQHMRLDVAASEVILATEAPRGLAESNLLEGKVAALGSEVAGHLLVEVDVGGQRLLSRLAAARAADLALDVGRPVWAIIHSASLRADVLAASS